jgi:hypothetical protein
VPIDGVMDLGVAALPTEAGERGVIHST